MSSRVLFTTTESGKSPLTAKETASGFNGFPFPIPELAEDGEPFKTWDGSTVHTLQEAIEADNDLPSGTISVHYMSSSSSKPVTTAGPNSAYCIGPFTRKEAIKLFWRIREFHRTITIEASMDAMAANNTGNTSSGSDTASINQSGNLRRAILVPNKIQPERYDRVIVRSEQDLCTYGIQTMLGVSSEDPSDGMKSDGYSKAYGNNSSNFNGGTEWPSVWGFVQEPVIKKMENQPDEYWFSPPGFVEFAVNNGFAASDGNDDVEASQSSSYRVGNGYTDYSYPSKSPFRKRTMYFPSRSDGIKYNGPNPNVAVSSSFEMNVLSLTLFDKNYTIPVIKQNHQQSTEWSINSFSSTALGSITIDAVGYFPYKNSKGAAVYDENSGDQLVDPAS